MDIIVDRPQLVRVVLLYLNKNFGNLTPMTNSEFPNLIFYVDSGNDIIMEYDKENEWVFIDYGRIWLELESLFSINLALATVLASSFSSGSSTLAALFLNVFFRHNSSAMSRSSHRLPSFSTTAAMIRLLVA